ncbi:MAG: hypothetical protein CL833_05930 [Crocinitomicaceae bacterium]|nr:hypothetical protein [Crocinitomicaceae bacterium]|tara:strand:+ start:499 stop:2352 length:1854 start_codon:yes stop_codon:yes gene_type:complete
MSIKKHMGDMKVEYKHGSVFVYKNNEEIDKFNPEDAYGKKIKSKSDLESVAKTRFSEVKDYLSPLGKDETEKLGIVDPNIKMYKLGRKFRLYNEKGQQLGDSSHDWKSLKTTAINYENEIKKAVQNAKSESDKQKNAQEHGDNVGKAKETLEGRLQNEKEIKNIENQIRKNEILPPKEPETPKETAPESNSIFDYIKNVTRFGEEDQKKDELPTIKPKSSSASSREQLKDLLKEGKITVDQFRELDNKFRGEEASQNFEQMIRDKQGQRRQTLGRYDDRVEKNESLLEKLDNYEEGVAQDLKSLKDLGNKQSERMQGMMPGDDFKLDWGIKPTFDNAKKIWDQDFAPNYKYSSDKPFDQRSHQFGLMGHAGGSAVDANQREKMAARSREELQNMAMIQDMLLKQQGARGVDISDIQSLGKNAMGYQQQGLDAQSNIMNPIFNQQQRAQEQGDDLARIRSEADTTLTNQEIQENAQLYDFLEAQRQKEMQELQGFKNLEFETEMAKINLQENALKAKMGDEKAFQDLWAQREQIYNMLEMAGLEKEKFRLQGKEANKNEWVNLIGSLIETAGTVAGAYYGGPAGAAAGKSIGKSANKLTSDLFGRAINKSTYESGGKE